MGEYRGGLTVDVIQGNLSTDDVGHLLEALKQWDGAVSVEADRLYLSFSFEASDLPGLMSGLAAAMPRVAGIATKALRASGLIDRIDVAGMSVDRVMVAEPDPNA